MSRLLEALKQLEPEAATATGPKAVQVPDAGLLSESQPAGEASFDVPPEQPIAAGPEPANPLDDEQTAADVANDSPDSLQLDCSSNGQDGMERSESASRAKVQSTSDGPLEQSAKSLVPTEADLKSPSIVDDPLPLETADQMESPSTVESKDGWRNSTDELPSSTSHLADLAADRAPRIKREPSQAVSRFESSLRQNLKSSRLGGQYQQLAANIYAAVPPEMQMSVMFCRVDQDTELSIVAAHIGAMMAQQGLGSVLIVDAELSARNLSRLLERGRDHGFSELLNRGTNAQDYIVATSIHGLHMLPAGNERVERIASAVPHFAGLVHELKYRYPFVLIDAGGATSCMAQALGRYCDLSYLAVRLGTTDAGLARRAVHKLRSAGSRLVGCIATNAPKTAA